MVDQMWENVIAVLLALAGGFARLLNSKDTEKFKWSKVFSELFVSGFAGLMLLMLARANGLTGDWLGVIAGMAGWLGPRILDVISAIITKKFT